MALFEKKTIVKNEIDYDKLAKAIAKESNLAIDYEKLTESITKAFIQNKENEKKEKAIEEEKNTANWRKTYGFKDIAKNDKWYRKIGVGLYNDLIALKVFILYKKDYAQKSAMTFGFMALICSIIFTVAQYIFLGGAIAVTVLVVKGKIDPIFILLDLFFLFFFNLMRVIKIEIDQMKDNDIINMVFSSLMAFIAALFTVLAFIRG